MSTPPPEVTEPRCSFCGKGASAVRHMVAGFAGYICDECADLCVAIGANSRGKGEINERIGKAVDAAFRAGVAHAGAMSGYYNRLVCSALYPPGQVPLHAPPRAEDQIAEITRAHQLLLP